MKSAGILPFVGCSSLFLRDHGLCGLGEGNHRETQASLESAGRSPRLMATTDPTSILPGSLVMVDPWHRFPLDFQFR
jgi:hypothetical protein